MDEESVLKTPAAKHRQEFDEARASTHKLKTYGGEFNDVTQHNQKAVVPHFYQ